MRVESAGTNALGAGSTVSNKDDLANDGNLAASDSSADLTASGGPRTFASVLGDIMQSPDGDDGPPDNNQNTMPVDSQRDQAQSEPSKRLSGHKADDKEPRADLGIAELQRPGVTGPIGPADEVSASQILHIADLDQIAKAVHAEVVPGLQSQVILELPRSVLEGLKIKLSATGPERISAEFLARTSQVKAVVDDNSSDLAAMLRSRGIELDNLSVSLAGPLAGQTYQDSKHGERQGSKNGPEAGVDGTARSVDRGQVQTEAQGSPDHNRLEQATLLRPTLYRA